MVIGLLAELGFEEERDPVCLAFANTIGNRNGENPHEGIPNAAVLGRWLAKRKLTDESQEFGEAFRKRALELREAIFVLFTSDGERSEALDSINGELTEALAKLELLTDGSWLLDVDHPGDRALMLIALSAAGLATSPLRHRVRQCADEHCGWLFIDHSKNRSRRWCSMSDCGNKAKARRFLDRRSAQRRVETT